MESQNEEEVYVVMGYDDYAEYSYVESIHRSLLNAEEAAKRKTKEYEEAYTYHVRIMKLES